jgi:hypothetical protein
LTTAAEQQKTANIESLIAAPLSISKINKAKTAFVEEWTRNRIAAALMGWKALYKVDDGTEKSGFLSVSARLEDKNWFVDSDESYSADTLGAHLGKSMANGENAYVADRVRESALLSDTDVGDRPPAEAAINYLLERGYTPNIILGANRHRLQNLIETSYTDEAPPLLAPRIIGVFHGIPVVEFWKLEARTIYVGALDRWAEWIQEELPDPATELLTIKSYSDIDARSLLEAQPELFSEFDTMEARVVALQQLVCVDAGPRFKLNVVDSEAIIGVRIKS